MGWCRPEGRWGMEGEAAVEAARGRRQVQGQERIRQAGKEVSPCVTAALSRTHCYSVCQARHIRTPPHTPATVPAQSPPQTYALAAPPLPPLLPASPPPASPHRYDKSYRPLRHDGRYQCRGKPGALMAGAATLLPLLPPAL